MIKKSILLLCFIFCVSCKSATYNLPSYKEIVTTFFTSYDLRANQRTSDIRFIKKKQGYYIQEYNYNTEDYEKPELYWNASTNAYQKISFPSNTNVNTDLANYHLNYYYNEMFNVLPYYGYVGWTKDVITFLEQKTDLTDIEHYALGRAYSIRSGHLLNNSYEFANPKEQFNFLESGENQFTANQLKTYKDYVEKAIKNYTILCNKNPEFVTVVGNICQKLSNEYVSAYLALSIYQNEEEAAAFLPNNLYTDFIIDYAKNYLNSVEPNGILFTTGDNDTFPFLYIQASLKYRQDITIVNTSLLNQNSYVNFLRREHKAKSNLVKFTLTPQAYSNNNLEYIILDDGKDKQNNAEYLNLKQALRLINVKDTSIFYRPQKQYANLNNKKIAITFKQDTLKLNYKDNYIIKGDLLALDIIESNITTRPIYCTFNEVPIVSSYLEKTGFVSQITPNPQNPIDDRYLAGINAEKTYDILVHEFQFHEGNKNSLETRLSTLTNYTSSYQLLAKHYQEVGDTKKCENVLTSFTKFYPKHLYAEIGIFTLDMLKTAYANKDVKNGNIMLEALLQNLESIKESNQDNDDLKKVQQLKKLIFGTELSNKLDRDKLNRYLFYISNLSKIEEVNSIAESRLHHLKQYFTEKLYNLEE